MFAEQYNISVWGEVWTSFLAVHHKRVPETQDPQLRHESSTLAPFTWLTPGHPPKKPGCKKNSHEPQVQTVCHARYNKSLLFETKASPASVKLRQANPMAYEEPAGMACKNLRPFTFFTGTLSLSRLLSQSTPLCQWRIARSLSQIALN